MKAATAFTDVHCAGQRLNGKVYIAVLLVTAAGPVLRALAFFMDFSSLPKGPSENHPPGAGTDPARPAFRPIAAGSRPMGRPFVTESRSYVAAHSRNPRLSETMA
ncbi:hypothetical protein [Amycolatopsis sp. NPDC059657]|uniref:hypothetical protein n=1 Tax=Amycolatopsis sp. NPDC059657 TaxID=3346899 RepID=UPI00366D66F1